MSEELDPLERLKQYIRQKTDDELLTAVIPQIAPVLRRAGWTPPPPPAHDPALTN